MTTTAPRPTNFRWQTVALPTEHGGWGLLIEPLLLGLLLAPTWPGLALSVAAFAAFLLRHPLKLVVKDYRAGRTVRRTQAAQQMVLLYGGVMAAAGLLMLWGMPSLMALVPLLLALPLIAIQLWHDVQNKGRHLLAELAGALATGAFAASIVLMGDTAPPVAFALWLALAVKGLTAVMYVRARIRLERDKPANRPAALIAHGVGWLMLLGLAAVNLLPWTALLAMTILVGRAVLGLSQWRQPRPPKAIGFQEMGYGFGFVLLIVLGKMLMA